MRSTEKARKILLEWLGSADPNPGLVSAIAAAIDEARDPFKNCKVIHPETYHYEQNKIVLHVEEHCADEDETRG